MTMTRKPILCVDFDGVIHAYTSPWTNAETISDGPVPGALRWLWKATEWFDVQVYSSRSKSDGARYNMLIWMITHSLEEFGIDHPMSMRIDKAMLSYPISFAAEKPAAFLTIDDRAICFEGDWSELDPASLLQFRPWNKRPKFEPGPAIGMAMDASAITQNGDGDPAAPSIKIVHDIAGAEGWDMGPISLVHEMRTLLMNAGMSDQGKGIDSGTGNGMADMWVSVGGVEYHIAVKRSDRQIAEDAKKRSA